ncbi:protein terminus [Drosophila sechellia]|uniref:GM14989 n=1 Tax=Drosophila sechellia TaxID=7238 RepID=B4IFV2_DROSE|nr:protein terminus [Drosophila sechellia]EDW46539.1 GM14989 [Drosophila sechellia]
MARRTQSRYIFDIEDNFRVFRHQFFVNGARRADCTTCESRVPVSEPYHHHWRNDIENNRSYCIQIGSEEKNILKRIEDQAIEEFILCDGSIVARTNDFLLDAGMDAVPQLLRFLSFGTEKLEATVGFYVDVKKERMYYESSPLNIENHFDIGEAVDMIFSMLLEKISNYVLLHQKVPLEACVIRRMKVTVKRFCISPKSNSLKLPLQYRVKNATEVIGNGSNKHSFDLSQLSETYINQKDRNQHIPANLKINLYTFRVCSTSKELYAVPYLLRGDDVENTPTFIIQTDVVGDFQGLLQIRNIRKFLRVDTHDRVFECRQCQSHFVDRVHLALHKQIACGRNFMVWYMDKDAIELHENCLPLPKEYFKYEWVGLARKRI